MEIDKKKLDEKIIIAKKSIASLYHFEDKEKIGRIEKLNKETCLAVANFKCQSCGAEKNLQIHHLIMKNAKRFMDFFRYASQRYYWANQIVLCKKCHVKIHKSAQAYYEDKSSIPIKEEEIKRIKNLFK